MVNIRIAQVKDAAGIARVHVDCWRTTYKGIFPDDLLANLSYKRREQSWQHILNDPAQLTFVTEDETGKIVGFANGGPERKGDPIFRGELYAIYVLQEAQRQGLGRHLTKELVKQLRERQFFSLMLWVLVDNPSRRFYETLGGQIIKQRQIKIGGSSYEELAYGWKDFSQLWL
ncbi:GNAT family N-acetyltransferase [Ktedonosporobacter rubrisoli]|uniref:GNAT family N-acetyltransferase n=1 Tax=Ktedonosporobacter rubrisoli TaxID=2509675 RepID=A0A4P6JN02_KTERU|nr:GNAT family N-acetyltransferase [Ktedonosporobacter rubrisoli]QBD76634.1 GNAT family N-acetyltransferase [Ktedonosporobacter rubrisoli]